MLGDYSTPWKLITENTQHSLMFWDFITFLLNLFLTQVFDEWKIIHWNLKQPFPEFITLFWNVKLNILMSLWAAFIKNVFQSSLNPICPYLQISNSIFNHENAQKPVDSKRKPKKSVQTWQINRSSFTLKT